MLNFKTEAELNAQSFAELARESTITNMGSGARARVTHEIFNRRLAEAYRTMSFNSAMRFLSTATGYFLDLIGEGRGIPRRQQSKAFVSREDENLKFYVVSGALKSKLPSGNVPVGTTVQNSTGTIQYQVTEAGVFNDVTDHVYVSAIAVTPGAASRVGRNILSVNSLGIADVLSTNEKEITNGTELEEDGNYRYRIANGRAAAETSNLIAVRISMLEVPGVSDVILNEYAGYIDALIVPSGNFASESTIRGCQFAAAREKAGGVRIVCRGPRSVPFEVYLKINLTKTTPTSSGPTIRELVRAAVLNYFDDIRLGGVFVVQELRARVQQADDRILDHELVCLMFRRRPQLIRNFQLAYDELFVPDPDSANPIAVVIA